MKLQDCRATFLLVNLVLQVQVDADDEEVRDGVKDTDTQ